MTLQAARVQNLPTRLMLVALVALAFVLDLSGTPDAIGSLLYASVLVACLYQRDRGALLGLGLVSTGLLMLAAGLDPAETLSQSLGGQRGSAIGTVLLIALPGAQVLRRWEQQQRRLTAQAQTDPLTGLANRRQLNQQLRRAWLQARRHHQELAVLMLDLDHFKRLNDTLGHLEGDALLIRFAALMGQCCRGYDLAGRYGGEEFMLICPNTDGQGALALAERIRTRWQRNTSALPESQTVSIGIAVLGPEQDAPEDLVARADEALYTAKTEGRNRCQLAMPVSAPEPTSPPPRQPLQLVREAVTPLRGI